MAFYLVSAVPKPGLLEELRRRLVRAEFLALRPFGPALSASLQQARFRQDGVAVWEEEDYCDPPLAAERAAVLDRYFLDFRVEPVIEGDGWRSVMVHPLLFPGLADD